MTISQLIFQRKNQTLSPAYIDSLLVTRNQHCRQTEICQTHIKEERASLNLNDQSTKNLYDFMKWRSFNYPIKILQTLVSATNLKGTYFKTLFTNRYTYLAKLHFYTFIQKKKKTGDSQTIQCFILKVDLICCKTVLLKIMKIGYEFYKLQ